MDNSFYIIKPETIQHSSEIHKIFFQHHLKIDHFKKVFIPENYIEQLYFDCSKEIIKATKYFLCNDFCEVGIVSGENAIKKLIEICGIETAPSKCHIGTIRNKFGIKEIQYFNGIDYYQNAIHRPETYKEKEHGIILINSMLYEDKNQQ